MKILLINTLYAPYKVGGAEVSVQLLAEGLVKKDHKVNVACLVAKNDAKALTIAHINGVTVHYLPLKNIYWPFDNKKKNPFKRLLWHIIDCYNPAMIKQIQNLQVEIKPDVIHTNNLAGFSAGLLRGLSKTNCKLVHTARDYYFLHPNCTLMRGAQRMKRNALSIKLWSGVRGVFLKKIDHFIGISQFVVDEYSAYYPWLANKYSVIYNPVRMDVALIEQEKKYQSPDYIVFGFIGRLSPEKGFADFYKFAQHCALTNMTAKFVAAGKGDALYLQQLKAEHPAANVELLGFVNSDDFYQSIDTLISPTIWPEPFGRTIVEARSHGVNVIAYRSGGIGEIFKIFNEEHFSVTSYAELLDLLIILINERPKLVTKHDPLFGLNEHCTVVNEKY